MSASAGATTSPRARMRARGRGGNGAKARFSCVTLVAPCIDRGKRREVSPHIRRDAARREHAGRETAYGLVTLAVVGVAAERQAGLSDRLQLARPDNRWGLLFDM